MGSGVLGLTWYLFAGDLGEEKGSSHGNFTDPRDRAAEALTLNYPRVGGYGGKKNTRNFLFLPRTPPTGDSFLAFHFPSPLPLGW